VGRRWGDVLRGYVRRRMALLVCVVAAFAAGLAAGALAVDRVDPEGRAALAGEVEALFRSAGSRPASPPAEVLRFALSEYILKHLALIGALGLSIAGAPGVLAVVFLRGFSLGFAAAFLAEAGWLVGAVLAVVALLPQNVLAVPATLAAGVAALSFAGAAVRALSGRRDVSVFRHLAGFVLILAASGAALVAAAFVEAYVSPVLMGTAARWLPMR